jgi:hypothetical protein
MGIDIPFALNASPSSTQSSPSKLVTKASSNFSIGNVKFAIDEAPDELEFPATQSLAVKDHVGGKRVIQGLGTVWKPITWEGYFWGANAQYQARQLMRMQSDASVQRLTYLSFALDVVIEQFFPNFLHQNQCKYKITVQVLNDASGAVSRVSTTSVDAQIQSCVNSSNDNLDDILNDDSSDNDDDPSDAELQAAHQQATSALDAAGPAAQATGPIVNSTLASIQNVISVGQKYLSSLPAGSISPKYLSLTQYVNNWTVAYKNFNTVQNHQQVTRNGGSLFEVASQYYGDPSLAIAIQQQNGLASTDLPSGVLSTIILPPLASS